MNREKYQKRGWGSSDKYLISHSFNCRPNDSKSSTVIFDYGESNGEWCKIYGAWKNIFIIAAKARIAKKIT